MAERETESMAEREEREGEVKSFPIIFLFPIKVV
jgi:hypothetical protein